MMWWFDLLCGNMTKNLGWNASGCPGRPVAEGIVVRRSLTLMLMIGGLLSSLAAQGIVAAAASPYKLAEYV
jgi:hypothetical protein